ncbi:heat shock 70 kDa protein 12B-like isoform X5 [Mytilus californianus]|uniref:heat shock 70 kDa protein 12B-like isoform X5 n=1 Tax=Mytilus californianus TaxID=6549 RepID=UPI002247CCAC|nr:heat shock 70 kDa protein 12B-like isoform X5 [Mytilus californianus]
MACGETTTEPLLVAAIDLGTTFSSYAFANRGEFKDDPTKISSCAWCTGSQPGLSLKTPTCILFDKVQNFFAFGAEAEDKYTELAQEEDHVDWFFFRRFKMQLYDKQEISRSLMLESENGCLMPAMKVFSESIKYLKTHLENHINSKTLCIKPHEIDWVLTIPAIWTDPAKQFMREAGNIAGIPNSRLILALEPEAASIYCKNLPVDRIVCSDGKSVLEVFSPGTKYLILDAGGGTIDITVQEIKPDGNIKQIYMANGGDWGGVKVDQAFEEFLTDIVGMETMEEFRKEDKEEYLSLCREFEMKKRDIRPAGKARFTIRIPVILSERLRDVKGMSLEVISRSNKSIVWVGDKLRLDSETAKSFFTKASRQIIDHMSGIIEESTVVGTEAIVMVGDFSESPMLQEAIKTAFPNMTVIIPDEAGVAVLKGAVQFGFNPQVISPRIGRFTYGVSTNKRFRPHTDPEDKKQIVNGVMYCRKRFGKHVERGQSIEQGEVSEQKTYNPLTADQNRIILPIYVSLSLDPQYVDEKDCTYLGDLEVDMSDIQGGCEREVVVGMRFGGPDIAVEAIVKSTGEIVNARFNCLR